MKVGGSVSETRTEAGLAPQRRRPPFWIVGLALVGVILLMLAGALLLDRRLRPTAGITPVRDVSAGTMPTATVSPSGAQPPASFSATQTPPEQDVQRTFERYLQIYSQAVLDLDASHLGEVLDGQALQWVTDEVNALKAQGRPVRIIEQDRSVVLAQVTDTSAVVIDQYVSLSVYANPQTLEPLPRTGPPTKVRQTYELHNVNGTWKIVNGVRDVLSEGGS